MGWTDGCADGRMIGCFDGCQNMQNNLTAVSKEVYLRTTRKRREKGTCDDGCLDGCDVG